MSATDARLISPLEPSPVDGLRASFRGELRLPTSAGYDAARTSKDSPDAQPVIAEMTSVRSPLVPHPTTGGRIP